MNDGLRVRVLRTVVLFTTTVFIFTITATRSVLPGAGPNSDVAAGVKMTLKLSVCGLRHLHL